MVQVRLPAEFLVEYDTMNTSRGTRVDRRRWQNEGARMVVLCPCLGEVHKDILRWGK